MSTGWRKGFADVVAAIQGTLADAANAGSMSAAEFLKLAGLPTSAVPTARLVNTTPPLTGGGDLTADRTLAISAASGAAAGSMSAADFSKLAGLPSSPALTVFEGPTISLLATGAATNIPIPDVGGGKLFKVIQQRVDVVSTTGGPATGSLTVQLIRAGVNWGLAGSIAAAAFNADDAPCTVTVSTAGPTIDPTVLNALQYQVTAAIGGYSAASGKVVVLGYYE